MFVLILLCLLCRLNSSPSKNRQGTQKSLVYGGHIAGMQGVIRSHIATYRSCLCNQPRYLDTIVIPPISCMYRVLLLPHVCSLCDPFWAARSSDPICPIFCRYFGLTTGCIVVVLASLLLAGTPSATSTRAAVTLGFALVASIVNWLLVEPVATKLMLQRCALVTRCHAFVLDEPCTCHLFSQYASGHAIGLCPQSDVTAVA